jgi:hypothetical protein
MQCAVEPDYFAVRHDIFDNMLHPSESICTQAAPNPVLPPVIRNVLAAIFMVSS